LESATSTWSSSDDSQNKLGLEILLITPAVLKRLNLTVHHSHLIYKNIKIQIKQNYHFISSFVQLWNFVSHLKGETYSECVKTDDEENIWMKERGNNRRLERTTL